MLSNRNKVVYSRKDVSVLFSTWMNCHWSCFKYCLSHWRWATLNNARSRQLLRGQNPSRKRQHSELLRRWLIVFSVSFHVGAKGNAVCPRGTSLVTDVNVCRDSAAISLGGTFAMCTSDHTGWGSCSVAAIGCFKHSTNRILFQSDGTKVTTSAFSWLRDWYLF